ncbi:phytase [Fomitiporia mediterranea MF3/22]|uniref:phytase n=1 Tax=Fomitiporia mediterranea (strain MF3/22) TaxID=694068 RepID=UPI0004408AAB|nr:phytase [Fomitiporia mediterranea MF3/22]EJD01743.1 phytase [Fomitiporia mediterranea MF3/22]
MPDAEASPLLGHPTRRAPQTKSALVRRTARRKESQLLFLAGLIIFIFVVTLLFTALSELEYKVKPVTPKIQLPKGIRESWAQYTPYFSTSDYTDPPSQCGITQVNIIQRHGARFPATDENEGKDIREALSKFGLVTTYLDPRLKFLQNYKYDLGEDGLVAFGAAQSFDSGQYDFTRYKDLVNKTNLPFIRASGSERVIDSANNWTSGFVHASHRKVKPLLDLIIEELPNSNNTLNNDQCPNAGNSDKQTQVWQNIYAEGIAARLNASAPGASLTAKDVTSLFKLCALETVAKSKPSDFCGMFDLKEFEDFEYYGDLNKYYKNGYGQDLGPVQGVGYVNELIARLTNSPVHDNTQTNRTLDSNPTTFPLDRPMYIDFSHENVMTSIYSALGLFRQEGGDLDPRNPDRERTWIASRLVPFSARLVTERLECSGMTVVRMFVNDRLQPLEFCDGDEEGDGLCLLDKFIESQRYARSDGAGDFERCFT